MDAEKYWRAVFEARLRNSHGQEWIDKHKGLLDSQWEFIVEDMGLPPVPKLPKEDE